MLFKSNGSGVGGGISTPTTIYLAQQKLRSLIWWKYPPSILRSVFWEKNNETTMRKKHPELGYTHLVGGWTNPFEKYDRQIGSKIPRDRPVNI